MKTIFLSITMLLLTPTMRLWGEEIAFHPVLPVSRQALDTEFATSGSLFVKALNQGGVALSTGCGIAAYNGRGNETLHYFGENVRTCVQAESQTVAIRLLFGVDQLVDFCFGPRMQLAALARVGETRRLVWASTISASRRTRTWELPQGECSWESCYSDGNSVYAIGDDRGQVNSLFVACARADRDSTPVLSRISLGCEFGYTHATIRGNDLIVFVKDTNVPASYRIVECASTPAGAVRVSSEYEGYVTCAEFDKRQRLVLAGSESGGENSFPGKMLVARMLETDIPDKTFGDKGRVLIDLDPWVLSELQREEGHDSDRRYSACSLAHDRKGKIVIGGYVRGGTTTRAILARLLCDGQLDPTFGAGGVIVIDFGGRNARIDAVAIDSRGRIVCAGFVDAKPNESFFMVMRIIDNSASVRENLRKLGTVN